MSGRRAGFGRGSQISVVPPASGGLAVSVRLLAVRQVPKVTFPRILYREIMAVCRAVVRVAA